MFFCQVSPNNFSRRPRSKSLGTDLKKILESMSRTLFLVMLHSVTWISLWCTLFCQLFCCPKAKLGLLTYRTTYLHDVNHCIYLIWLSNFELTNYPTATHSLNKFQKKQQQQQTNKQQTPYDSSLFVIQELLLAHSKSESTLQENDIWRTIIRRLTLREKCPNMEFFLVRIFPHSDWIRRDTMYLSVFSPNAGKYRPEKAPCLNIFHTL